MSGLQALIFDVDGTLADTERDGHRIAFNQTFQEAGLDWDWSVELYGELLQVTGGKERMRFYLERFRPDWPQPENIRSLITELHKAKTKHYTKLLSEGAIPLRPGVLRLLEAARARRLRLAIATTTTPANVTALLENTLPDGGLGWFEVIAAGDIVPAKKPAPDIYNFALAQMKLSADECLAFEDSENGILSSTQAGLKTVVTINDYTKDHTFTGAALVLDHFGEPDLPFTVLQGTAGDKTFVDLELLEQLHQSAIA